MNYLHTQFHRHHRINREAIEDTLRRKEFRNMMIDWKQASDYQKDIVKDYRRIKFLPRKEQLEIINQLNYEIISSNEDSSL